MKTNHKSQSLGAILLSLMLASAGNAETVTVVNDGDYGVPITGNIDLVKNGNTTFTLSGSNTYSGTTVINAGTLKITSTNGLSPSAGVITVNSGAVLEFAASNALGFAANNPRDIIVNGGKIVQSASGQHSNLGNVTLNGGFIEATGTSTEYGNFLLGGKVTVTDNASINCAKILIRQSANGVPDKANVGVFDIAEGKILTVNSELNFADTDYAAGKYSTMIVTGSGKLLLAKAMSNTSFRGSNIIVDGAILDLGVQNVFGNARSVMGAKLETNGTIRLTNGGVLNVSTTGHANIGNLILDGGTITAVNTDGERLEGSTYGNILLVGTTKVTEDSQIAATVFIRGGDEAQGAGKFTIDSGKTLTFTGKLNFIGKDGENDRNEGGKVTIDGGGTFLLATGAASWKGWAQNTITVTGEGTTLQYGSGGESGGWLFPMILENGGTFRTNRSQMSGNYEFTVTASDAVISNDGSAVIHFNKPVTIQNSDKDVDLTITGKTQIDINAGNLKGTGTLLKTGTNVLALPGANTEYSGNVIVEGGILAFNNALSMGTGAIEMNGGSIRNSAEVRLANPLHIAANSGILSNGKLILTGKLTGSEDIVKTGSNQLHLQGDSREFSGTITSQTSWLGFHGPNSGSSKARYVLDNGTSADGIVLNPQSDTDFIELGMLETANGNATVRPGLDAMNAGTKTVNLRVGGENSAEAPVMDGIFAGKFTDYQSIIMNVEKSGKGTWTLAGQNTHSGSTNVKGGTLLLTGSLKSPVTVYDGAFLAIDGGTAENVTIQNGGSLLPFEGTITGQLAFERGSEYVIDLTNDNVFDVLMTDAHPLEAAEVNGEMTILLTVDDSTLSSLLGDEESVVLDVLQFVSDNSELIVEINDTNASGIWSTVMTERGLALMASLGGGGESEAVPEPSAWILFLCGIGIAGWLRSGKKETKK